MGMGNIDFIVPICIHSLIKLQDVENDNYSGVMSILKSTVYNNTTVKSEWKKMYAYALEHDFRFLSYGDGNLIFIN